MVILLASIAMLVLLCDEMMELTYPLGFTLTCVDNNGNDPLLL